VKLSVAIAIIVLVLFSTQASSEVFLTSKTDRIFLSKILKDLELMGPKDELIDDLGEFVEKRPYSSLTDRAILKLANRKPFTGLPTAAFSAGVWTGPGSFRPTSKNQAKHPRRSSSRPWSSPKRFQSSSPSSR
jgi:hypothetical protein